MPTTEIAPARRRTALALLAILALAAVARFAGLDFGLSLPYARPDENRGAGHATRQLGGDWRPPNFAYPALFPMVNAGIRFATDEAPPAPTAPANLSAAFWVSRVMSATTGVLTVLLLFFLARRLGSTTQGLVPAALLAVSHLHSRDCHFGVTDAALTFATTGVLLLLVRTIEMPRKRRFALCGAAIGVAASIKQPAIWLAAPLLFEAFAPARGEVGTAARGVAVRFGRGAGALLIAGLCAAVAFVVLNPFTLIEPQRFLDDVLFEFTHKTTAHASFAERGFATNASFTLWLGLGGPYVLAALAGLLLSGIGRQRGDAIVVLFALAYYAGMGSGTQTFARYMLPLAPLAALFAARAIVTSTRCLPLHVRGPATWLIAAAVAALSIGRLVRTNELLMARDTRLLAADFIGAQVAGDERVLWIGRYSWPPGDPRIEPRDRAFLEKLLAGDVEPKVALQKAGYRYLVTADHWLLSPFDASPALSERLARSLQEWKSFSPLAPEAARARLTPCFDRHDFFYVPYANFAGFERPGPFLRLYRCDG